MPPRNTNHAEHLQQIQVQQEHYSGPLPQPEALAKYDQIVPGAAERILRMAEKEMEHRHDVDVSATKHAVRVTYLGIIFAFIAVLILSGAVIFALHKGYDTVAGAIAVGAIAAVAGVFITAKVKQSAK